MKQNLFVNKQEKYNLGKLNFNRDSTCTIRQRCTWGTNFACNGHSCILPFMCYGDGEPEGGWYNFLEFNTVSCSAYYLEIGRARKSAVDAYSIVFGVEWNFYDNGKKAWIYVAQPWVYNFLGSWVDCGAVVRFRCLVNKRMISWFQMLKTSLSEDAR